MLFPLLLELLRLDFLLRLLFSRLLVLHLELDGQCSFLLFAPFVLQLLLALLALNFGEVALMPQPVVELVVRPLLSHDGSFFIELIVALSDAAELNDLGVHRAQIVDAGTPLLVELLLHDGLSLILSALFEVVGPCGQLLHALLGRLFTVDHLLLESPLLGVELRGQLLTPRLQVGLMLRFESGGLRLHLVGADDAVHPVLPLALLLDLETVEMGSHEAFMDGFLLLPLQDRPVGPQVHRDGRHRFRWPRAPDCGPER
mmetsp:Transcript_39277/g.113561  ORF Transcript_39277/g.113561 Transcript_39277/m.113561 type:complete len:258 (+) Transcript_39277:852-1625(+)